MKAHKRVMMVALSAILASAVLMVNAVPALADEVNEQTAIINEDNTITDNTQVSENPEINEIIEKTDNADTVDNTDITDNTDYTETVEDAVLSGEDLSREVIDDPVQNTETKLVTEVTNWNKYEPNNELTITKDKLPGSVIAGKMTKNQPMVIWTDRPLTAEEQQTVWNSLKGNPGVGNPKNVVFIDGDKASQYGMTIDTENGTVKFDGKNNWSLIYSGEYKKNESDNNPSHEVEPGHELDPRPEIQPDQEKTSEPEILPETDVTSEPEEKPEVDVTPEPEEKPEVDVTPEPEEKPEVDVTPEHEEKTKDEATPEPEEKTKDEATPKPEKKTENIATPEPEEKTKDDVTPEHEEKPETDVTPGLEDKSQHSTSISGGSGSGSGNGVRISGSSSGGPGVVHELDDQPETGLLDAARGRQLDDVPRTGMPAEFMILFAVSVAALIILAVTLVVERKTGKQKK